MPSRVNCRLANSSRSSATFRSWSSTWTNSPLEVKNGPRKSIPEAFNDLRASLNSSPCRVVWSAIPVSSSASQPNTRSVYPIGGSPAELLNPSKNRRAFRLAKSLHLIALQFGSIKGIFNGNSRQDPIGLHCGRRLTDGFPGSLRNIQEDTCHFWIKQNSGPPFDFIARGLERQSRMVRAVRGHGIDCVRHRKYPRS